MGAQPRKKIALALVAALAACGEPAAPAGPDASSGGADAALAVAADAGADSGFELDAGLAGPDAATADAGGLADTGPDSGRPDATGASDAATADASGTDASAADAGRRFDAGAPDASSGPFLVRGASASYHVTSTVTVNNVGGGLTRLTVQVPAPQTNLYQDVAQLSVGTGIVKPIPETDDFYVLFTQTSGFPGLGKSVAYSIAYDVTLYDLSVDLARVTAIQPYDTGSDAYRWYTGASGEVVVPTNPTIQSVSASLWSAHPDVLGYTRAAYEYVAANYAYLNPNTGLHSLSDVLAAGGGDCGNLTSIFVSLVRAKNIPARHLITIRPDGTFHVWADFLLQGYGWVPVDVTYKQSNRSGDYFGKVALATNGILMTKEVDLTLETGAGTVNVAGLQHYAWWYWWSSPVTLTSSYAIAATRK